MGVQIADLVKEHKRKVELEALKGKIIAVDAYNALYQFLSIIRQRDGSPLMDSRGRITSHLSGLYYRTINLVEQDIRPVYVFDGEPPDFKRKEIEERIERREEAEEMWKKALRIGDIESARIYAQQASKLTEEMVEDAKRLLEALGLPWVQAPSEGEAQAAYMARKGDVWASASQDYDSLLFGTKRLVRNLNITGKRKLPRKEIYIEIKPEIIELETFLSTLGISRQKLVWIGILVGTDYNEGVKGVGPKRALGIVKQASSLQEALKMVGAEIENAEEIEKFFLDPPVTDDYELKFFEPDKEKIMKILVDEHDFSPERVEHALEKILEKKGVQTGLEQWF